MKYFLALGGMFVLFMSGALIYIAAAPLWDESFVRIPDSMAWGMLAFSIVFVATLWTGIISELRKGFK